MLATQLADVVLAAPAHLGRRSVADVGVVRPHDGFGCGPMEFQYVLSVSNIWLSRKFQDAREP